MNTETYLNHPTFGLLYRVCLLDGTRELFATLYAQRLFFIVAAGSQGIQFEPIGRSDARILVESRLRELRRNRFTSGSASSSSSDYDALHLVYQQTFQ